MFYVNTYCLLIHKLYNNFQGRLNGKKEFIIPLFDNIYAIKKGIFSTINGGI